jgi:transposase-like protein
MTQINRVKKQYTNEEKVRLVARMLPPENITVTNLAIETGVAKSTLAKWKNNSLHIIPNNSFLKTKSAVSSQEKFLIVMESYALSEVELSRYCREKGLYVEEVKKWRTSCQGANNIEDANSKELKQELYEDKKKIKELEKELTRKEKALAEVAALLVLKKKLGAILGDAAED